MKALVRSIAALLLVISSAVVLITGFEKAASPSHFAALVASHGLFASDWSFIAAATLAWTQIAAGIAGLWLLLAGKPLTSASVLAGMFMTFGVYAALIALTVEQPQGHCGCLALLREAENTSRAEWARIAIRSSLASSLLIGCGLCRHTSKRPRSSDDRGLGLA